MKNIMSFELILLVISLFIFIIFKVFLLKRRKNRSYNKFDSDLRLISEASFNVQPLMNKSEFNLYLYLNQILNEFDKKHKIRLFSQVSMGEFLTSENYHHFRLVNSKRVDFLIIDHKGLPIMVIEYQGKGHFQNNAIERDAIKKEACRKAGIHYIEITEATSKLETEFMIKQKLTQYIENRKC